MQQGIPDPGIRQNAGIPVNTDWSFSWWVDRDAVGTNSDSSAGGRARTHHIFRQHPILPLLSLMLFLCLFAGRHGEAGHRALSRTLRGMFCRQGPATMAIQCYQLYHQHSHRSLCLLAGAPTPMTPMPTTCGFTCCLSLLFSLGRSTRLVQNSPCYMRTRESAHLKLSRSADAGRKCHVELSCVLRTTIVLHPPPSYCCASPADRGHSTGPPP